MSQSASAPKLPDVLTIAATGVVAYTSSALLHEGAGHGGLCLAVGGHITALTSTYLQCDGEVARSSERAIEAAGTLMNLLCGAIAVAALGRVTQRSVSAYFLWLFAAVNLLQGGGYLLVSPLGHFGDWDAFVQGLSGEWFWRIGLTIIGVAISLLVAHVLGRTLVPFLGDDEPRQKRLNRLVRVAYLAGCAVDVAAGTLNPMGWQIVLVSSIGSAVFGTCWLIFVVPPIAEKKPAVSSVVDSARSWGWIAAGIACAGVNFFFGSGLHWAS